MLRRRMLLQQARLPADYQEVEWIGASGTQHIDTLYNFKVGDSVEIEFMPTVTSYGCLYGAYSGTGNNGRFYLLDNYGSSRIDYVYDSAYSNVSATLPRNVWHKVKLADGSITINGTSTQFARTQTGNATVSSYIFANNYTGTGNDRFKGRIKSVKVANATSVIQHFVPCYRKSDGIIGMYDMVNGTFHTNAGSGTFTRGGVVEPSDLKFNQLIPNGNFVDATEWTSASGTISASNNVLSYTITGLTSNKYSARIVPYLNGRDIPYTANHKYFVMYDIKAPYNNMSAVMFNGYYDMGNPTPNQWVTLSRICNPTSVGYNFWTVIYNTATNYAIGDVVQYRKYMAIDLTAMYGAEKEPTDVATVMEDCSNIGHPLSVYQAYTPIS